MYRLAWRNTMAVHDYGHRARPQQATANTARPELLQKVGEQVASFTGRVENTWKFRVNRQAVWSKYEGQKAATLSGQDKTGCLELTSSRGCPRPATTMITPPTRLPGSPGGPASATASTPPPSGPLQPVPEAPRPARALAAAAATAPPSSPSADGVLEMPCSSRALTSMTAATLSGLSGATIICRSDGTCGRAGQMVPGATNG